MESLSRAKQITFYEREIQCILDEYALYFKSNISDLRKSRDLFLGTYLRTDNKRGNIIVKFRKMTAPALKIPLLALKLPDSAYNFDNWDKITFESVRGQAEITSDTLPVFIQNRTSVWAAKYYTNKYEIHYYFMLFVSTFVPWLFIRVLFNQKVIHLIYKTALKKQ